MSHHIHDTDLFELFQRDVIHEVGVCGYVLLWAAFAPVRVLGPDLESRLLAFFELLQRYLESLDDSDRLTLAQYKLHVTLIKHSVVMVTGELHCRDKENSE